MLYFFSWKKKYQKIQGSSNIRPLYHPLSRSAGQTQNETQDIILLFKQVVSFCYMLAIARIPADQLRGWYSRSSAYDEPMPARIRFCNRETGIKRDVVSLSFLFSAFVQIFNPFFLILPRYLHVWKCHCSIVFSRIVHKISVLYPFWHLMLTTCCT